MLQSLAGCAKKSFKNLLIDQNVTNIQNHGYKNRCDTKIRMPGLGDRCLGNNMGNGEGSRNLWPLPRPNKSVEPALPESILLPDCPKRSPVCSHTGDLYQSDFRRSWQAMSSIGSYRIHPAPGEQRSPAVPFQDLPVQRVVRRLVVVPTANLWKYGERVSDQNSPRGLKGYLYYSCIHKYP